jgi:hypothetical protein
MPYEHDAEPAPRAPAWARDPLFDAAVWFGLALLMLVTLLLSDGPLWVVLLFAGFLGLQTGTVVRREVRRRRDRAERLD